jgi:hypothetical protein
MFLATLGLTYKIDVIEWIPYFGASAGLWRSDLPEGYLESRQELALGGYLGMDYAVSRAFGLGVATRVHWLLSGEAVTDMFLRGEYRWGW